MAERRMFAKSVTSSARFLRMPATSRLLYYDLGMDADDDGFVEAFAVIRKTGATEDDLNVLASRGFVRVINEDLVAHITEWKVNNYLRPDRYKPSLYHSILVQLESGTPTDNQPSTIGIPSVDLGSTQDRLGKDRLGKDSKSESADKPPTRKRFSPPSVEDVRAYCQERGNTVDPQRFVAHYESNGWRVGKNPMRDWKAAVRYWEKSEKEDGRGKNNLGKVDPDWSFGTRL